MMYIFSGLEGKRVQLVPLQLEHAACLFNCSRDPGIWANYPTKINTIDDMNRFIQQALDARDRKEQYPYAVFDKELGEYVGSTRFLRISEENNNLNMGSTWYSSKVWRTRINTETKYLMLKYAFETLNVVRVELVTTTENERSQQAIERLGATKEGILRKKYNQMDYVIYGIINNEWHGVKNRLECFLGEEEHTDVRKSMHVGTKDRGVP